MVNTLVSQGVTVYAWILTHQGEHTTSDFFGIEPHGVCHSDELIYMWDPVFFQNYDIKGDSKVCGDILNNELSFPH